MDFNEIKRLMDAMGEHKIKKLTLRSKNGAELHLEKEGEEIAHHAPHHHAPPPPPKEKHAVKHPIHTKATEETETQEKAGHVITSPMVGTFYASPSPEDPPFVKEGDQVKDDTVVCIIEAMKVMNEVKAGKSGVVKEIYAKNAQPVEFETKLFRIE